MKILWVCLTLIGLLIAFQSFIASNASKTEKQKYRLVLKEEDFEIRFYPAAVMATVYSNATNYNAAANKGFRKLAGFIFGGNDKKEGISMTAPVHMNISEKGSTMSFVMPEKFTVQNIPNPNDSSIHIHNTAAQYTASIQFPGYANDAKIELYKNKLLALLTKKQIKIIGDYVFLGYNAPYQFVARTNEILIPIEWKE